MRTHLVLPAIPTQVQDAAKQACCAHYQQCCKQSALLHQVYTHSKLAKCQLVQRNVVHWVQAKRRVYTVQSGSKGAAGKRKRADGATANGASAGRSCASVQCFYKSWLPSLSGKAGVGALQGPYNCLVCWHSNLCSWICYTSCTVCASASCLHE